MKPNAALALKRTAQSHSAKARLLRAETIAPVNLVPVQQDAALDKVTHPAELAQAETAAPQEAQALSNDTAVTTAAPEATAVVTAEEPQYLAGQAGADLAAATGGTGLPMGVVVAGLTGAALIGVGNEAAATPGVTKTGTPDADVLEGGAGDDVLNGLAGDDVLKGYGGADTLNGGLGSNTLDGGANNDTAIYVNQNTTLRATVQTTIGLDSYDLSMFIDLNEGIAQDYSTHYYQESGLDFVNDVLIGIENVTTGNGDDSVVMSANNVVNVGEGYNYVWTVDSYTEGDVSVAGNHTIIGGDGGNHINLYGEGNNVVTLGNGQNYVSGNDGNNVITLGDGGNTIYVYDGNNKITTGAGFDNISLGEGTNTVSAGAGYDFISMHSNTNVVDGGDGYDTVEVNLLEGTINTSGFTNIEQLNINSGTSNTINLSMASVFNMTSADENGVHSLDLYFDIGQAADVVSFGDLTLEGTPEIGSFYSSASYSGSYQGHSIFVYAYGYDYNEY